MAGSERGPSTNELPEPEWGSDLVALALRDAGIEYIALNPGASYRGLHDSLVNYLGNTAPEIIVCLHEEHAVALAHGYAKVLGRPMAAAVHSNVGLMHASMAIFNAWCDRAPVLVLGATGPLDSTKRRPWIEWIHTATDQGALVRNYTKWDDQPASPEAALEGISRALQISQTLPFGPTYVCLDQTVQTTRLTGSVKLADRSRHGSPRLPAPDEAGVLRAVEILSAARRPVILIGRVSRDPDDWRRRVELAERLQAHVITDLKVAAGFPTRHPLHSGAPGYVVSPENRAIIQKADAILDLDFVDPAGSTTGPDGIPVSVPHIRASMECYMTRGWTADHCKLAEIDLDFPVPPDALVRSLLSRLPVLAKPGGASHRQPEQSVRPERLNLDILAATVNEAFENLPVTYVRLPLRWPGSHCNFAQPLDYIGYDGGGGIGSGPGMAVGAALALKGKGRLPVAILGDGDFLMGANAIWTAARYRIPLLVIVANNQGYQNDVNHQAAVARERDRSIENRYVGQAIDDPAPDIPGLARDFGWSASPEVSDPLYLLPKILEGVRLVQQGGCHLVSVQIFEE